MMAVRPAAREAFPTFSDDGGKTGKQTGSTLTRGLPIKLTDRRVVIAEKGTIRILLASGAKLATEPYGYKVDASAQSSAEG